MADKSGILPLDPGGKDRELFNLSSDDMREALTEARHMMELLVEYKDLRMTYECALKSMRMRFEVLDEEFSTRYQHNPISFMKTRIKSNPSIVGKMQRRRIPFSIENMERNILDIAGIRIICSYLDDIYALADALLRQDDITLISRKDYIANPKPNGYRSLHLVVSVPVYFADQKKQIPVEVQIRTIAMDFWASLEHQMKYKQNIPDQQEIVKRLTSCADRIAALDREMQEIRSQIDAAKGEPSRDEVLIRRLQHLGDSL